MKPVDLPTHVPILAWFNIVASGLFMFIGIFVFVFLTGIGAVVDDPEATRIMSFVGAAIAVFLVVLSLPGLVAGIGLLKRASWARTLAIVVAILDLFCIPIGTAIGIYALWVLTAEGAAAYFGPPSAPPA